MDLSALILIFDLEMRNTSRPYRSFHRLLFVLGLFLCLHNMSLAQKEQAIPISERFRVFRHFTVEQGLSNNWISTIAQDDDGFMWFGTQEGLNRFDGEQFTNFYCRADGKSLPSNIIQVIIALPGNRVLVGTPNGLCVLFTRRLEFEMISLPARAEFKKTDLFVRTLLRARDGKIWVGTDSGIFVLDNDLHVVAQYLKPDPWPVGRNYLALEFLDLPGGTMAFKGNHNPWQVVDFQKNTCARLTTLYPAYGPLDSAMFANSVTADGQNGLWYTTLGTRLKNAASLLYFNFRDNTARPYLYQTDFIFSKDQLSRPLLLPDSLLLLQEYFGKPLVWDPRNGQKTYLDYWNTSWPDGDLALPFVDRSGQLWVGHRTDGIHFFSLKPSPIRPFTALNQAHEDMMQKHYAQIWFPFTATELHGKWLIGAANGGLYAVDKQSGQVNSVYDEKQKGISYISTFVPYKGDSVWMSTLMGFAWYNVANNTFGLLRKSALKNSTQGLLFRDSRGLIWGKEYMNGVTRLNPETGEFRHYSSQGDTAIFPMPSISAITEDKRGDMWFAYAHNSTFLVKWERETGVFHKIEAQNPSGLQYSNASQVLADPFDNIWLVSEEGLFIYDIMRNAVRPFGRENGLSANRIERLDCDAKGNVWFATQNGLSCYNALSHNVKTFYQADGLLSSAILYVKLLDRAQNLLLVTTTKGFCLVDANGALKEVGTQPLLHVTGLWASERQFALPESGIWELSYHQNDIRIGYTGINYIDGDKNRYQYKLDGADDDWIDAKDTKFASYLNLVPGYYTFHVRCAGSDGVWTEDQVILKLRIFPPFWATWTFRLTLITLLAALAWWLYKRQIRLVEAREKDKARIRQQLADLEMKALRSQMNPHFVFNALNSVQNFILKNDTREASRYLTKFARLMRLILENSESPLVSLAREIELLKHYTELEALRFNHRFSFEFLLDPAINAESVSIPGMLIQPHIENAIWHGLMHKNEAGKLWIRILKTDENTLCCEIEDNGVGRAAAALLEKDRMKIHRSTGLENIRTRLQLLNAQLANNIRFDVEDLYDEHAQARGTLVKVRIPITNFS